MDIISIKEREIEGRTYSVHPFLGRECFLHYAALTKIIGEPLTQGLIAAITQPSDDAGSPVAYLKGNALDKDATEYVPAVIGAIGTLTQKLDPNELLTLISAMLKKTSIIEESELGKRIERPINIDLDFGGGRMKPLFKLFLFVMEVNFADFLPSGLDLGTVVKNVAETVKAAK